MTFEDAVALVMYALRAAYAQQIFIAKAPSFSMIRLCQAFGCGMAILGTRPGEKLHEVLIHEYEAGRTHDYGDHYRITPEVPYDDEIEFCYRDAIEPHTEYQSYTNTDWLTVEQLRRMI